MNFFKSHKKRCDIKQIEIFKSLEKNVLLQEAKYFNSSTVHPKKCVQILTKILYLLYQGESLSDQEATHLFFSITKLFQPDAVILRRLVYLSLKELSLKSPNVIIVTSSLTKDIRGKVDMLSSAAIRTLCSIIDSSTLCNMERYLKEAIVDKNPAVSSAALVSALHLTDTVPELAERLVNLAQEMIISDNEMVSYHALGLLTIVRRNNQLSIVKIVTRLLSTTIQSPYTLHLVIRCAAQLSEDSQLSGKCIDFIESCMQHKIEFVAYEALHAFIRLSKSPKKLTQVMPILKVFCTSSHTTVRLVGARSIAAINMRYPYIITKTNCIDFDSLVFDPNKRVATMALITILSVGTPSTIKHIMRPLLYLMADMPDEYKIIIVHTIKRLFSNFPRKYPSVLFNLAAMLRGEGSAEYKYAIVEAITPFIECDNRYIKENGLIQLCEYVEDCEHKCLAIRILNILGHEGPKSNEPTRLIRYIYNRILLEPAPVRAAAVVTMARFGAAQPDLLSSVKVLLNRCQCDDDDEVRERAVFYKELLDSGDFNLINNYITNVGIPNVVTLEKALFEHLRNHPDHHFDMTCFPAEVIEQKDDEILKQIENRCQAIDTSEKRQKIKQETFPDLENIGVIFKICEPDDLTECGADYKVRCIKHVFERNLLLKFECLNTLCDRVLENVHINLSNLNGYIKIAETTCEQLLFDKQEIILVLFEFPKNPQQSLGWFSAILEFTVNHCDPENQSLPGSSERYHDVCYLDEIVITRGIQFLMYDSINDWETKWEVASQEVEVCDTFGMLYTNLEDAANAICEHLELPSNYYTSTINGHEFREIRGGGIWRSGIPVLIKIKLQYKRAFLSVEMYVRSPDQDVAAFVFVDLVPGAFVVK